MPIYDREWKPMMEVGDHQQVLDYAIRQTTRTNLRQVHVKEYRMSQALQLSS